MKGVARVSVGEVIRFSLWTALVGVAVGSFAAFGCTQDSGVDHQTACALGSKPGRLGIVIAPAGILLGVVGGTGGRYRAVRIATVILVGAQIVALGMFMLLWRL